MKGTSRSRVIVVAAVVIAVLASLSFLVGRGLIAGNAAGSPSTTPTTQTPKVGTSGSPSAGSAGSLGRGTVKAVGGGTKTGPGGVSLGFPQTKEGAVSAATSYWSMAFTSAIADPQVAEDLVAAIALPGKSTEVAKTLQEWSDLNAPPRQVTCHPAWGAYAVDSFYEESAYIYLWWPRVYVDPASPTPGTLLLGGTHWDVVSVRLEWSNGDWKWATFDPARVSKNVAPAVPTSPPTPQEKYQVLYRPNPDQSFLDYQSLVWLEYADAP